MTTIIIAVAGILVLAALLYLIVLYNSLVSLKHSVDKAWSNIDVLLKQRFDELPKLVEVVKGYQIHEQEVLERLTRARAMLQQGPGTEEARHSAEDQISQALRGLFAVVENYPELKADKAFRQLQTRISQIEDMIADRRELFNEYVNTFNIRQEQFPDLLVARLMGLTPRKLWKIDPEQRQDVKISFD